MRDGGQRKRSKFDLTAFMGFHVESALHEYSYINLGCLAESSHRVHVVIEDDDPHHHPHAEHECLLTCKPASVFPKREDTATASLPCSNTCILRSTTGYSSTPTTPTLHRTHPGPATTQVNMLLKRPKMIISLESIQLAIQCKNMVNERAVNSFFCFPSAASSPCTSTPAHQS